MSRRWKWILIGVAVTLAVVGIAGLIAYLFVDDALDDRAARSDGVSDDGVDYSQSFDGADDVGPCQLVGTDAVLFEVTNPRADNSNYFVDVIFRDAGGERVRDETFIMDYLRGGESASEPLQITGADDAVSCEIVAVERFDHESPLDPAGAACEITGVDAGDDLMVEVEVENTLDDTVDYFADVAVIRDGVRLGSSFADIGNVSGGETARDVALSLVDGPVDGATCDIINLRIIP